MPTLTKWCIACKAELQGSEATGLDFMGLGGGNGLFCATTDCARYGLITVIFLKEQKKAPEDATSNNPVESKKETEDE